MNEILKIISTVPIGLLKDAEAEITALDWTMYTKMDTTRRIQGAFATSTAIILRYLSLESAICKDSSNRWQFSATNMLIDWIYNTVNGIALGKVMIVNLEPYGIVGDHVDDGPYFVQHARFHVPIKTTPGMLFKGEHMPIGHLCCLNNSGVHGGINNSEIERIHLIVDVQPQDSDRKQYFR